MKCFATFLLLLAFCEKCLSIVCLSNGRIRSPRHFHPVKHIDLRSHGGDILLLRQSLTELLLIDNDSISYDSATETDTFYESSTDSSNNIVEEIRNDISAQPIKLKSFTSESPVAPFAPPAGLMSKSFLLLNSVAIIWGTQHVVIKTALESFPAPSVLNFWRFTLSFLLFLPAFISVLVRNVLCDTSALLAECSIPNSIPNATTELE